MADQENKIKVKKNEPSFMKKKKPVSERTLEEHAEAEAKKALVDEAREGHKAMVLGNSVILVEGKHDKHIEALRNMLTFLAAIEPPSLDEYVDKYKAKKASDLTEEQKKSIANQRRRYLWVSKFAQNILKPASEPTHLRSNEVEEVLSELKKEASLSYKISSLVEDLEKEKKKFEQREQHSKNLDDFSTEELESLAKELNEAQDKGSEKNFGWERAFEYNGKIHKAYKLTRKQIALIEKLFYDFKNISLQRSDVDYKKEDWKKSKKKETPKSEFLINFQKRQEEKKKQDKEKEVELDFGTEEPESKKTASVESESHTPLQQVQSLIGVAADLEKLIDPKSDLEDWVGSKIARALSDITDLKNYLEYHTVENKYNTPNSFDIGAVSLDSIASSVNRIKSIIGRKTK